MSYKILAVNPGSTSTKAACYEDEASVVEITVRHSTEELARFDSVADQLDFRIELIRTAFAGKGIDTQRMDAVVGRGGLVKPIPSGVYEVNQRMLDDLRTGRYGSHASNLGAMIADSLTAGTTARAFIADPVVVDEMEEVAKITGLAALRRRSVFHALNQKATARAYAASKGVAYESLNLIVAHLGGGISVGAHRRGQVVDVNNALDGDGPFSPERAGSLPTRAFASMIIEGGMGPAEVSKKLAGKGGLVDLLGTNDVREVIARAEGGDPQAGLVFEAMCYNISKEIGSMAAVLSGNVDAIILTGGIAYSPEVCGRIERMCGFIATVTVMPGENELESLASNALAVLRGTLEAREYI